MASTYLSLGGARREQAVRQVADAAEAKLRGGKSLTTTALDNLAEAHEVLRNECGVAIHIAVAGVAFSKVVEQAAEVAGQFARAGRVEEQALAGLASAVALRETLDVLLEQMDAEVLGAHVVRASSRGTPPL